MPRRARKARDFGDDYDVAADDSSGDEAENSRPSKRSKGKERERKRDFDDD